MAQNASSKSPATGTKKGGNALGLAIAGIVLMVVVVVAGSTAVVTTTEGARAARIEVSKDLGGSQAVQTALQQQRYQRLNLISRIFATDQVLTSYLAEAARARDQAAILASVEEYQNLLTFDLAVVLDRDGVVLTRTDRSGEGEDLSSTPLVSVALDESKASGVWQQGDQLYHAVAVPLVRQFELVGYIAVAYSINNTLAMQIKRTGGAEIVFLADTGSGPEPVVSTLDPAQSSALAGALRKQGEVLDRVIGKAETANDIELDLGDESWVGFLSPLRDAGGGSVGAVVALTSMGNKVGSFERIRFLAAMAGLASAVAGVLLGLLLALRVQRPYKLVADAAAQGAAGHLEVPIPKVGGDAGRIAGALRTVLGKVREKNALEFVVGRVSRFLPEPARGSVGSAKPSSEQACLVGIDMLRFVDAKLGYDPDDCLNRLDRDLKRIGTSAAAQKGRVVGLFGHRVLIQFTGEHHTYRAACAATEILLTLAERENVFDEPNPPAVALAVGPLVSGSVNIGDQVSGAATGPTVQALEGLLREASPGFLYFTKDAYPALVPLFQRAEVEAKGQRPRIGEEPLYYVDADSAARATGAKAMAGASEEGRSFGDLTPGLVLANRFELRAELGAGPMGVVYKAADRDLGDLVTLKMLRPEVVQDGAMFERLKRGVARARSIRHPNILSVLDFGEVERMPYIQMEFARGMTLEFMLAQAGRLPMLAGLRLARQIAWALQAAHGNQLMHGGLKPANILIEGNGDLKVMDFSLGMPVRPNQPVQDPAFLSPEQLEAKEPDSRADFYGFGALAYTLLTGQAPYPGSTAEEVQERIATAEPAPPSTLVAEIPPKLEQILTKCLQKAPEGRYSTIDDLVADLDDVQP